MSKRKPLGPLDVLARLSGFTVHTGTAFFPAEKDVRRLRELRALFATQPGSERTLREVSEHMRTTDMDAFRLCAKACDEGWLMRCETLSTYVYLP